MLPSIAIAGEVTEGAITKLDGKGCFELKTDAGEMIVFHASNTLLGDRLEFKTKRWPHLYKDLQVGDQVSLRWQTDVKTGKKVADAIGIKKRGS
jgi:hypothetical protein